MSRCVVPGCDDRRFTVRLCYHHHMAWTASSECHEGDRTKDFAGTWARWLKKFEVQPWKWNGT